MAFDGSAWNETIPTNSDLANEVDDFIRDAKIAVRSRIAHEHNWSASQTATGSDGGHKYITLSTQTSTPSLVYGTSTQAAVVFANTANDVIVSDKTGVGYTIVGSARGLLIANGTGTLGAIPYVTSGGGTALLAAGSSGYVLTAQTTAAPAWAALPGYAFGDWQTTSDNTVIEATADTIVCGLRINAGDTTIYGYTDSANPPTVVRQIGNTFTDGSPHASVTFPVKKGHYWKTVNCNTTYFMPVGT